MFISHLFSRLVFSTALLTIALGAAVPSSSGPFHHQLSTRAKSTGESSKQATKPYKRPSPTKPMKIGLAPGYSCYVILPTKDLAIYLGMDPHCRQYGLVMMLVRTADPESPYGSVGFNDVVDQLEWPKDGLQKAKETWAGWTWQGYRCDYDYLLKDQDNRAQVPSSRLGQIRFAVREKGTYPLPNYGVTFRKKGGNYNEESLSGLFVTIPIKTSPGFLLAELVREVGDRPFGEVERYLDGIQHPDGTKHKEMVERLEGKGCFFTPNSKLDMSALVQTDHFCVAPETLEKMRQDFRRGGKKSKRKESKESEDRVGRGF